MPDKLMLVQNFEPGDGTRYEYLFLRGVNDRNRPIIVFGFGVGSEAMVTFAFPEEIFCAYGYFAEKYAKLKREHTIFVGYLLFCRLIAQNPYGFPDIEHPVFEKLTHEALAAASLAV